MVGEVTSGDLNRISHSIDKLADVQRAMGNQLGKVAQDQQATRNELQMLIVQFLEFEKRDDQRKNVQEAKQNITNLKLELEKKFGHYDLLRRRATGIVEAVDMRTVTHDTVQSLSELGAIDAPGYWLGPALVGLGAWLRDDRSISDNAVRNALRLDQSKTSLFYALVLRRFGRTAAAAHWIRRYVERQDPAALPREFAVILDAVATGALGQESRPLVLEAVSEWYDRLSADPEIVAAQVTRWRDLIRSLRTPVDPRIKVLPEVSPDWNRLKDAYEDATVHGRAHLLMHAILDEPITQPDGLRERVDAILTSLVSEFDQEEAPLRRKLAFNEAVEAHRGDLDAAEATARQEIAVLDDTSDYLTLLTNAAFFPEKSGTSLATRQLAVALTRDWIVAADVKLAEANRASLPRTVNVRLEGWTGDLASGVPLERMEKALQSSIAKKAEADAANIKPGPAYAWGLIGAGVFLLITVITALHRAVGGVIVCAVIAGVCAIVAVRESQSVPLRQEEVRSKARKRAASAVNTLRQASAEYTDLMTAWQTEDEKAAPLTDYLAELKVGAVLSRSPDQIREVMK